MSLVLTGGVDLAAEPKGTALAVIRWGAVSAELIDLQLGVDDATITASSAGLDKLGIDCAFGWPADFVRFVASHANPSEPREAADGGMDWRRRLAYRATDRMVRERTGRWPLSVSTDRIGVTALRCAGLLDRLAEHGVAIDRSGAGLVVEVYPGASLRLWGFNTTGYRADASVRAELLAAMLDAAPWLDLGAAIPLMIASCDAFDAVVAALAARGAALNLHAGPPVDLLECARSEGWIALPEGGIDDLMPGLG